ncbi:MAG: MarR family winged helix-turn-helix transcriptional regulator [Planctomycetota bacterium]
MAADRLYELLERLGTLLRSDARHVASRHGLQPAQLAALLYLTRCNRYSDTPMAVTEYLGVTKGTASQTLQRLQDKQLVSRSADAADGRRQRLRPTARGRRIAASVPSETLSAALQASVGRDFEDALAGLLRQVQQANGSRTFGLCRTCRHFRRGQGAAAHQCGLTMEPLRDPEPERICREHEPRTDRELAD